MNWHDLTHGAQALILGYGVIVVAMLAGLLLGQAPWPKYLWLPVIAIPVTLDGGFFMSLLGMLGSPQPTALCSRPFENSRAPLF